MSIIDFFDKLGRSLSRQHIRKIEAALRMAGVSIRAEVLVGLLLSFTILLSIAIFGFLYTSQKFYLLASAISGKLPFPFKVIFSASILLYLISIVLSASTLFLLSYTYLSFSSESRRKLVESTLPDFLMIASANIRAGMPVDQALWQAAKPEFGLLSREVEAAAKRAFAGEPFTTSLDKLASSFDSPLLMRTVSLIKQSMLTGGKTADVLDEIAQDGRNIQITSKEISSSLLMYVIFVLFASVIGSPFLMAVSHSLLSTLYAAFSKLPSAQVERGFAFFSLSKPPFSPDEFVVFSIGVILFTSITSSIIIGIIQKGSKWHGVRYIPFLSALSLIVFFTTKAFLQGLGFAVV
ncbi:MAG: type II secretion system F family protein [Candidatus Anstonellales archaeon]